MNEGCMRKILTDAIAIANGAGRTVAFRPRESEGFSYYSPTSKWLNPLFVGGYDFTRPPPDITKEGVIFDHGKLSAKQAVTGADGVATVTYTAPEGAPQGNTDPVIVVTLLVTPIGTDYANALFRSVNLRLVPRGVILPPNNPPVAFFTVAHAEKSTERAVSSSTAR